MSSIGPLTSTPPPRPEDPRWIQSLQDRYDALRPSPPASREEERREGQESLPPAHGDADLRDSSAGALAVAVAPLPMPLMELRVAAALPLLAPPVPASPDGISTSQAMQVMNTTARPYATTRQTVGPAESSRNVLQAGRSDAAIRTVPGPPVGYAIARTEPANVDARNRANAQQPAGMQLVVGADAGAPRAVDASANAVAMDRLIAASVASQPTNAVARMDASAEARAARLPPDADAARVGIPLQVAPPGYTSTPAGVAGPAAPPSQTFPPRNGGANVALAAQVAATGAGAHHGSVATLTVPLAGLGDGHSIMASWPHGMQGAYLQLRASSGLGSRLLSDALQGSGDFILGGWQVEASSHADDHQPRRHRQHESAWEDE